LCAPQQKGSAGIRLKSTEDKKMKLLLIAGLLLSVCLSTGVGQSADDLTLRIKLTTGERSKDSSSQITTLTIAPGANTIVWGRTFSGGRRRTPPESKEFTLAPADRAALLKLIRARDLLVTNSIAIPDDSGYAYFAISVGLILDGKKGTISISGPRTAAKVKEEKLYQDTLALVKEIYRIINAQDKTVRFEELVVK
jgi:hypothetical protein